MTKREELLAPQSYDPSRLGWHVPDNLRWLAEQSDRPDYMPCGVLTGIFLRECADRLEEAAAATLRALADQKTPTVTDPASPPSA